MRLPVTAIALLGFLEIIKIEQLVSAFNVLLCTLRDRLHGPRHNAIIKLDRSSILRESGIPRSLRCWPLDADRSRSSEIQCTQLSIDGVSANLGYPWLVVGGPWTRKRATPHILWYKLKIAAAPTDRAPPFASLSLVNIGSRMHMQNDMQRYAASQINSLPGLQMRTDLRATIAPQGTNSLAMALMDASIACRMRRLPSHHACQYVVQNKRLP